MKKVQKIGDECRSSNRYIHGSDTRYIFRAKNGLVHGENRGARCGADSGVRCRDLFYEKMT